MLELIKSVPRHTWSIAGFVFLLCFAYRLLMSVPEANWNLFTEFLPALRFASVPAIVALGLGLFYNQITVRKRR